MKTLMMIRKMKEVLTWVWIVVIGAAICLNVCAQTPQDWKGLEKQLNFYMANDLGRNGYYDQKPIAELMGEMADVIGPECVFAAGDVHHFEGVRSVNDPLWVLPSSSLPSARRAMSSASICPEAVCGAASTGHCRSRRTACKVSSSGLPGPTLTP